MSVDTLLHLIYTYTKAQREIDEASSGACHDWDCGIAGEMAGQYLLPGKREELDRIRHLIHESLNAYIDQRVETILQERQS